MTSSENQDVQHVEAEIAFSEFLESVAPSTLRRIADLAFLDTNSNGIRISTPEIQLHCSDDACNGIRFFRFIDRYRPSTSDDTFNHFFMTYRCSNCRRIEKTFSLAAQRDKDDYSGVCYKFGEFPVYGPPTPARLVTLIGPDRETFLKGRRCENLGLGIGAFVYYRRVVENQKSRIIGEIHKVAKRLGVPEEHLSALEAARAETQFTKSMQLAKDAIPQVLLIDGHNPLILLHAALSKGLHEQTDESCLEVANSVRVVLGELSERLAQALKDEAELNKAISRLMAAKSDG